MDAVGRLAGGIAHDFGNLLTAIAAHAEQLVEELPEPRDPHAPAVQIAAATDRAIELVHRLMDVARDRPVTSEPVDLGHLLGDVAGLLTRSLSYNVRVEARVQPDVPTIIGDAGNLHAALLNLGINAGHAMPDGGRILITARRRRLYTAAAGVRRGRYVEIQVRDDGEGMDPEIRRRIFEPFFTTRRHHGTGLGLTRVYHCVKSHGGAIDVESERGRGTVFTILLPERVAPAARQQRAS
jgi:two-component system cell cycle sensor histidine kinase/response regulator CckA